MSTYKPYSVVVMPLNANGDGPEMDHTKVVKTVYEIWDEDLVTAATCDNEKDAKAETERLNAKALDGKDGGK